MHDDKRQIGFAADVLRLRISHHLLRRRQHDMIHARIHEVLEEHLLRALLGVNPWIVRQIIRHRLIAVAQIACAKQSVDHLHGRWLTFFRRLVSIRQRQRLLHLCPMLPVHVELLTLGIIADQDRRAV